MLDLYIAAQITAFYQALTEFLDCTNFIINYFDGFVVEGKVIDVPQWDTWDPAYG